jgi:diaminopropionate ammonia-lyase
MLLSASGFRLLENPRAERTAPYRADGRDDILSLGGLERAKREITAWPGYRPTPLRRLRKLAAAAGIGDILYKDEAGRFGISSFKALGGAYAVFRVLQQEIRRQTGTLVTSRDLLSGRHAEATSRMTVTAATDGNHGRSVAWGARSFGCRCVIYLPESTSEGRWRAIAAYGAQVRRVPGTYDDAVRRAAADAAAHGWHVVSDTAYEGCMDVPRHVMLGYALMAEEALAQAPPGTPTHVFVQGGVGGLAAAVCSYLWERLGTDRPRTMVVEPDQADCLYRSAQCGRPTPAEGALDTIMVGLACGEVSLLAWPILDRGADAFMTVGDDAAAECMRLLAFDRVGDGAICAGESAVAGLAGLLLAASDDDARRRLALHPDSTALVLGTEGATDPELFHKIVGRSADEVCRAMSSEQAEA